MMRGDFRFRAPTHEYLVGGVRVPGVTTVLASQGWADEDSREGSSEFGHRWFKPEHRERGTLVHLATLRYDLGAVVPPIPDEWRGYFDAYVAFRAAVPCRFTMLEHPKLNRQLRYATTVDRAGRVNGTQAVLEIKTGQAADFHGPQLAGQDMALGGPRGVRRRLAVYLGADGRFRLREYDSVEDYINFRAALGRYWEVYGEAL